MKLEEQVFSLLQAKKLSALGIKGSHILAHVNKDQDEYEIMPAFGYPWEYHPVYRDYKHIFPAWTVAELTLMLRDETLRLQFIKKVYVVQPFNSKIAPARGRTLAVALAYLLIQMIERKAVQVADINNLLKESQ